MEPEYINDCTGTSMDAHMDACQSKMLQAKHDLRGVSQQDEALALEAVAHAGRVEEPPGADGSGWEVVHIGNVYDLDPAAYWRDAGSGCSVPSDGPSQVAASIIVREHMRAEVWGGVAEG